MRTSLGRRALCTGLPLALTCLAATAAHADYAFKNIPASRIYTYDLNIPAGSLVDIQTTNCSAGADTVLHLWNKNTGTELAYGDDVGGDLRSSILFYNNTGAALNTVVVMRAFNTVTQGTADVTIGGVTVASGVRVGGNRIAVPTGATYTYETAQVPNGATDTYLLGVNAANHLVSLDDDSGVGNASRLMGRADVSSAIVGTWVNSAEGNASLYVNDPWTDADGDGLGAALEAALQTCNSPGDAACAGVFNRADTDRDGLSDSAETFGIDDGTSPQFLPRWGANPRHKDVFVEVDYWSDFATPPVVGADAVAAQAYFTGGPAADLQNPDAVAGVNLHLDIGTNPVDPAQAALFGSWGGANQVPTGADYRTIADTQRSAVRSGVFHYALATTGGGGQGVLAGDRFGWAVAAGNRNVGAFVHELGHNLALQHHGHDAWGAVNCKPNYDSIMNYAFPGTGFSVTPSAFVLNPSAVSESQGFAPEATPAGLTGDPFYEATSGAQVDWNRDGTYTVSGRNALGVPFGLVRAGATWGTWQSCNAFDRAAQTLRTGSDADLLPFARNTPAIARRGDRLFAFWIGSDARIHARQAQTNGGTSNGSCSGGQGLSDSCFTWGAEQVLVTADTAKSVSAIGWNDTTVVLAYQSSTDALRTLTSTGIDASGNLTTWSAEKVLAGTTTKEPELAVMRVNSASFGGSSTVLGLFYRAKATSNYKWYSAPTPTGTYTDRGNLLDTAGAAITGALSPTVADVENGANTQHCAALTNVASQVRLYCYDRATNRWANEAANAWNTLPMPTTSGKPALAFHVFRDWLGAAIGGDVTRGQFFLGVIAGAGFPDVFLGNTLSAGVPAHGNISFRQVGKLGNEWSHVPTGSGVALYEDPTLGAMKGLMVQDVYVHYNAAGNPISAEHPSSIDFLPLADGTFSAQLRDGADFKVMERGICLGLRGEAICGTAATTVSGL